ncbi:MAG: glycerophosphodiester phosphodiesterase [Clostridia bacterium]|nr:glycerophosphodiester phosphodiesterase [Clostridia bacterium]
MKTQIWAHRGASAYAPENTIEAFALARDMGADGIELDVHMTKDGQIVVAHDDKVDRCTNGTGYIKDMTLVELKKLDCSNHMEKYTGARMPLLEEVLILLKPTNMFINIELKAGFEPEEGLEEKVASIVEEHGMSDRVIYSSFNHASLLRISEFAPDTPIGLLESSTIVDPWFYIDHVGADAWHAVYPTLQQPGIVAGLKAHGIKIHPWTVDDVDAIISMLHLKVDAIITNKPDIALKLREQFSEQE